MPLQHSSILGHTFSRSNYTYRSDRLVWHRVLSSHPRDAIPSSTAHRQERKVEFPLSLQEANFGVVLNKWGAVAGWQAKTANVSDTQFHPLLKEFEEEMIIFADTGFHSKEGDPKNVKICQRGTRNVRMVVERVFSLLTRVCHSKQMEHRVWEYFEMRLGYLMAIFNLLIQWRGIEVDEQGVSHLSGVSRDLCKRPGLNKGQSPFKENRKLVERRTPVLDRHRPFLAQIL